MKKILLVAGGTGGHYFPAEALLEEMVEANYTVNLITDNRCMGYISYPLLTKIINVKKLSGTSFYKIIGLINLPISVLRSILFMWKFNPDLLITFGGYTSIPHLISAKILNIPIVIHEQNSFVGRANLQFCKDAKLIMLSYKDTINLPEKYKSKSIFTGNFVRKKLLVNKSYKKQDDKFTILILGGSQGAQVFSVEITNAIIALSKTHNNIKVIQQVVPKDLDTVKKIYQGSMVEAEIESFFIDISKKYLESDLVIARSGASTIAELIALSKPSILIPMPNSADNHQYFNARLLEDKSASILIEQKNIKTNLTKTINMLLNNNSKLKLMRNSLKKLQINGIQILFNSIDKLFD